MSKLLFLLFLWLVQTDCSYQSYARAQCSLPELPHGRVRRRTGARLARFSCGPGYELVGNKYATCRYGRWDVPLPVCVRAGCDELEVENGMTIPSHRGAWTVVYCFPGYKLAGSLALYCDGYRWNATTPKCIPDKGLAQLSCDFESEDLCGWRQDELHDFDWTRLNRKTPSSFLFTGPSYDHTFGKGFSGHYMFIESTSQLTNQSARLISPIYDGSLAKNGCFSFFYHMYGKSIGGLRVYQLPEGIHQMHANLTWSDKADYLLFEKWGDHGDFWFRNVSKLSDTADNFQIVIEGIRGSSFTSDIAIDDVAILQGADCDAAIETAVTPPEFSENCAGRCDILGNLPSGRNCGCTATCITDDNCCPDFFELCVYGGAIPATFAQGPSDDDDSIDSRTSDQPLTEKLIRMLSTPPTTTPSSTTLLPTTTATPRSFPPRPTRVTIITTNSTTRMPTTSTTPSTTTTTRKPTTLTAKPAPTTRRTFPTSTRPTTTRPTPRPTSTARVPSTIRTTTRVSTTAAVKSDAAKSKMEQAMQARKVAEEKTDSSGSSAAIVTALVLAAAAGCALAALALRSARGRAALARLRARAKADPEVRYLTRDDD